MQQFEQIKDYLRGNNINQQEVANALGVKQSYVSQVLNGKKPITRSAADVLSERFGFSLVWLLTGEGNMLKGETGNVTATNGSVAVTGNATAGNITTHAAPTGCASPELEQRVRKNEERLQSHEERIKSLEERISLSQALIDEKERLIQVLLEKGKGQ